MKKIVVMLMLGCFAGTMIAQNATQQTPTNVVAKDKDKDRDHDKDHDKDHHHHHHHHDHDHKGGDKK